MALNPELTVPVVCVQADEDEGEGDPEQRDTGRLQRSKEQTRGIKKSLSNNEMRPSILVVDNNNLALSERRAGALILPYHRVLNGQRFSKVGNGALPAHTHAHTHTLHTDRHKREEETTEHTGKPRLKATIMTQGFS